MLPQTTNSETIKMIIKQKATEMPEEKAKDETCEGIIIRVIDRRGNYHYHFIEGSSSYIDDLERIMAKHSEDGGERLIRTPIRDSIDACLLAQYTQNLERTKNKNFLGERK